MNPRSLRLAFIVSVFGAFVLLSLRGAAFAEQLAADNITLGQALTASADRASPDSADSKDRDSSDGKGSKDDGKSDDHSSDDKSSKDNDKSDDGSSDDKGSKDDDKSDDGSSDDKDSKDDDSSSSDDSSSDDEPDRLPGFSIGDGQAREIDEFTEVPVIVQVELSEASRKSATVNWSTENGTAEAGADYFPASGQITIAPGELTFSITVFITGDDTPEPTESFFIRLTSPVGAVLLDELGEVLVLDDDIDEE